MRRSVIAVIGSFIALTAPAIAGPVSGTSESLTTRIAYDPASLSSEAGIAQLYVRITEAAEAMCADLNQSAVDRAWCEREAVSYAVTRAQVPSLSLYHQMQTGSGDQGVGLTQR